VLTNDDLEDIFERVRKDFVGEIWHCETYAIQPEENYDGEEAEDI